MDQVKTEDKIIRIQSDWYQVCEQLNQKERGSIWGSIGNEHVSFNVTKDELASESYKFQTETASWSCSLLPHIPLSDSQQPQQQKSSVRSSLLQVSYQGLTQTFHAPAKTISLPSLSAATTRISPLSLCVQKTTGEL